MTFQEALVAHLRANVALAAIVDVRIFPLMRDQDSAIPSLVYQRVSSVRQYTVNGYVGWRDERYQFTFWTDRVSDAEGGAAALHDAIGGFTGVMGGEEGVLVGACFQVGGSNVFAEGPNLYEGVADYMIEWFQA